jgi:hypothetical protein
MSARQRMKLKRSREAEGRTVIPPIGVRPETVLVLFETNHLRSARPTRKELADAVEKMLDGLRAGDISK